MSRSRAALASAWIAILLAGCSAGRYDGRRRQDEEPDYAKAVEKYRERAPFAVLQVESAEVAGGRIAVRFPEGFTPVTAGPPAIEGEPPVSPDPSRLRPEFLADLPGYQATYERRMMSENIELPVSVGVWTLEGGGSRTKVEKLEKLLLDKARGDEAFEQVSQAWAGREVRPSVDVPKGQGPAAWRVVSLNGKEVFESLVAGNQEHKRWDSTCELWLSAEPIEDMRVLLVWRVPGPLAGSLPVPLEQLAETVARTAAIRPAPADAGHAADPKPPAPAEVQAPPGPAAGF